MHSYVVVALLPAPSALGVPSVGDSFASSRWPLHITLSTNFDIDAEPDAVALPVEQVAACHPAIWVCGGERAMFGSRGTTEVTLIEPREPVAALHAALAARLDLEGARFLYPEHMGDGYRPHATVQRTPAGTARLNTGQRLLLDAIALVDRAPDGDRHLRRVVSTHALA